MLDIVSEIKKLDLPSDEFAVFGSGPLAIRKIREAKDIDLIVSKFLWTKLLDDIHVGKKNWEIISDEKILVGNNIEIFNSWTNLDISIEELITSADVFSGIRFVKLDYVISWKQALGRKKDIEDIALIRAFEKNI